MAQDPPSARIYLVVGSNSLQSVRCLDCGIVYGKPSGGGTLTRNPGCPGCGYVGWLSLTDRRKCRGVAAPPRIPGSACGRQQADAAEVVMQRRPPAYLEPGPLELA